MKLRTFALTVWFVLTVFLGISRLAISDNSSCYPKDREAANICDDYVTPEEQQRGQIGLGLLVISIVSFGGFLNVSLKPFKETDP